MNNYKISNFDTRFFEMTFYSYLMRMRKPEIKIYKQVLKEAGIIANDSLFIDNNMENVEKAREAGIHSSYHNPKNEIIDYLKEYLADHNE